MKKELKIGILDCDKIAPELQKEFSSYSEAFEQLLLSVHVECNVNKTLAYKRYNVIENEYPRTLDECDAYLITGSKNSVYEDLPWISTLQEFVRTLNTAQKKTVGICFGHQMIAHSLQGETKKNADGWDIGVSTVAVTKTKPWMKPVKKDFSLLVNHQDQVLTLPPQAELLAGNKFCPYASFQIGGHMLCFQGHPEFTKSYSRQLMEMRRERIGDTRVNQGIESLQHETDQQIITLWILNFMGDR